MSHFTDADSAWILGPLDDTTVALCRQFTAQSLQLLVSTDDTTALDEAGVAYTTLAASAQHTPDSAAPLWMTLADATATESKLLWVVCALPDNTTTSEREQAQVAIVESLSQSEQQPTVVTRIDEEIQSIAQNKWQRRVAHKTLQARARRDAAKWRVSRLADQGVIAEGVGLALTEWPMGVDRPFERYFDASEWLSSTQGAELIAGEPPDEMSLLNLDVALRAAQWADESSICAVASGGRLCSFAVSALTGTRSILRALTLASTGAAGATMVCSDSINLTTARAITSNPSWSQLRVFAASEIHPEAVETLTTDGVLVLALPKPWTGRVHRELLPTSFGVFSRALRAPSSQYVFGEPLGTTPLAEGDATMLQVALHVGALVPSRAVVIADAEGSLAICGGQGLASDAAQIALARVRTVARPSVAVMDGALTHPALIKRFVDAKVTAIAVAEPTPMPEEVLSAANAAGLCLLAAPGDWRSTLSR